MKASIENKLIALVERHEEVARLLSDSKIINDQNRFRDLSKEYAQLEPLVESFQVYQQFLERKQQAIAMQEDTDPEIRSLAEDEMYAVASQLEKAEIDLQLLLLPQDPNDKRNIYLEVRAGTGGDEAAIFAGDLFRMYTRYAEEMGWRSEIISESLGEHGGYKEVIVKISGQDVYSRLKFESGAHRVQRVPTTESQGRVHTSACTVAILPEVDEVEAIDINPADLRVDTYRASGAGGQHINKTDSAIRLTHIPTGVVVECQDERSQHKNRARAMSLLQSRLLAAEQQRQQQQRAQERRDLVGSGDRSERIRTYNYPQARVTEHRINLTLYKLPEIMAGGLGQIIEPLIHEHQTDLLAELADK